MADIGCSAFAATLVGNKVLKKLSLNRNYIGVAGATTMAEALQSNPSLQVLGLRWNYVGGDGAVVIANALRTNTNLARLDLGGNNISNEGAMAILTTLKCYNCTLAALNLKDNTFFPPVPQEAIMCVLDSRQVLHFLLKHLLEPLEARSIPLFIQAVHRGSIFDKKVELSQCDKAAGIAGYVFHLVRAAALNESKVIKERARSRKRPRAPFELCMMWPKIIRCKFLTG
jgi:Leucine Rich repeat